MLTLSAALFSAWHASAQAPSPTVDAAPADEVSRIPLDAPLLYELLLGEMTAAQGDAQDAVALLLDAAGKTNLQALYQRATEVALRARSGPLALRSARAWQQAFRNRAWPTATCCKFCSCSTASPIRSSP